MNIARTEKSDLDDFTHDKELIMGIIKSGLEQHIDIEYYQSQVFFYHCELIDVDPEAFLIGLMQQYPVFKWAYDNKINIYFRPDFFRSKEASYTQHHPELTDITHPYKTLYVVSHEHKDNTWTYDGYYFHTFYNYHANFLSKKNKRLKENSKKSVKYHLTSPNSWSTLSLAVSDLRTSSETLANHSARSSLKSVEPNEITNSYNKYNYYNFTNLDSNYNYNKYNYSTYSLAHTQLEPNYSNNNILNINNNYNPTLRLNELDYYNIYINNIIILLYNIYIYKFLYHISFRDIVTIIADIVNNDTVRNYKYTKLLNILFTRLYSVRRVRKINPQRFTITKQNIVDLSVSLDRNFINTSWMDLLANVHPEMNNPISKKTIELDDILNNLSDEPIQLYSRSIFETVVNTTAMERSVLTKAIEKCVVQDKQLLVSPLAARWCKKEGLPLYLLNNSVIVESMDRLDKDDPLYYNGNIGAEVHKLMDDVTWTKASMIGYKPAV